MEAFKLPENVNKIISTLENNGFEAYVVGGCVRDYMSYRLYEQESISVNKNIDKKLFSEYSAVDYDLATSASPEEMHRVLSDFRLIDTGIKHGTVTCVFQECKQKIEITTFRVDGNYSDKRRPDFVRFSGSLEEDLARRDFTVNAMAYSESKGLVDLFGGQEDLKNKTLKCVGEPEKRLAEDALRIMRALRFISEHDFKCEKETEKALFLKKELLNEISPERVQSELLRIICGRYAERVLLEYKDIIAVIIPEIIPCIGFSQRSKYHVYDVFTHTAKALASAPFLKEIRLAMLLHDIGKPPSFSLKGETGHFYGHPKKSAEIAESILRRLRFDNETRKHVLLLINYHDCKIISENIKIKQDLNRFGEEAFFQLLDVHRADDGAKADFAKTRFKTYDEAESIARDIVEKNECYSLKQLKITGHDIMARGYKGKETGRILQLLLSAVIGNKVNNEKTDLLTFIDKNKKMWQNILLNG